MMARRGVIGGLIGGAMLLLTMTGCALGSKSSYRFAMTIEVDTPEGVRRGTSVYEVSARNQPGLDPSGMVRGWKVRGEAVAVDLPGGRTLFALLKTSAIHNDLAGLSMKALDPAFKNDVVESAQRISRGNGIRSPADVAPSDYPILVTFREIDDPKSVEAVDPGNLEASFGTGVRLRRITVDVTDHEVTAGIEQRLPWLPNYYGKLFSGQRFERATPDLADHLGAGDFSTELSK